MKPDEIDVRAKSVYAADRFELAMKDGRPAVVHQAARGNRGALVAVYVTARDRRGALQLEIFSRARLNQLLTLKSNDDRDVAREAESFATRRMAIRLMGAPAAAVA